MINPNNRDPRAGAAGGQSALAAFAAQPRGGPAPAGADPSQAAQTLMAMRNAAQWIRSAPEHLRDAAFARIAPMLRGMLTPQQFEMVRRAPKDDHSIDAFIAELERRLGAVLGPAGARRPGAPTPGPRVLPARPAP